MRERELPGYVSMWDAISPDVIRAQRQADLANMAKYRAAKMLSYEAWSSAPIEYDLAWDHHDMGLEGEEFAELSELRQKEIEAMRRKRSLYYEHQRLRSADKLQAEARNEMSGKYIDDYRVRTIKADTFIGRSIDWVPLAKPVVKQNIWRKLISWFESL